MELSPAIETPRPVFKHTAAAPDVLRHEGHFSEYLQYGEHHQGRRLEEGTEVSQRLEA
jgi:hypothetical protein